MQTPKRPPLQTPMQIPTQPRMQTPNANSMQTQMLTPTKTPMLTPTKTPMQTPRKLQSKLDTHFNANSNANSIQTSMQTPMQTPMQTQMQTPMRTRCKLQCKLQCKLRCKAYQLPITPRTTTITSYEHNPHGANKLCFGHPTRPRALATTFDSPLSAVPGGGRLHDHNVSQQIVDARRNDNDSAFQWRPHHAYPDRINVPHHA
jgi:hypothetical protein